MAAGLNGVACSDLANAKNLHGRERKKFRAKCKRKGGKM
jgi:psiF repeat